MTPPPVARPENKDGGQVLFHHIYRVTPRLMLAYWRPSSSPMGLRVQPWVSQIRRSRRCDAGAGIAAPCLGPVAMICLAKTLWRQP